MRKPFTMDDMSRAEVVYGELDVSGWGEPGESNPGGRPPSADAERVAETLRTRPGRWAVIASDSMPERGNLAERRRVRARLSSHGTAIRTGSRVSFAPAGTFEATLRTVPVSDPSVPAAAAVTDAGEVCLLWARYVGDGGGRG